MKQAVLKSMLSAILFLSLVAGKSEACSRVVYTADSLVITGRTMDWPGNMQTNIYVYPRGLKQVGMPSGSTISWTSKYGSVVASQFDAVTSDGINEKGLVVNTLWLPKSGFVRENEQRPVLSILMWAQYVLDNFATVSEAVETLRKEEFRIDAPTLAGTEITMHMSLSDPTGNNAILEYIGGNLKIYEGKRYKVMTNEPSYDKQLAITDYWMEEDILSALPGRVHSADRFVRLSFFLREMKKTTDAGEAAVQVLSMIRNISTPYGLLKPGHKMINSRTLWRTMADQTNLLYYYEDATRIGGTLFLDLKQIDFKVGSPVLKLDITNNSYCGNANKELKPVAFMNVFTKVKMLLESGVTL